MCTITNIQPSQDLSPVHMVHEDYETTADEMIPVSENYTHCTCRIYNPTFGGFDPTISFFELIIAKCDVVLIIVEGHTKLGFSPQSVLCCNIHAMQFSLHCLDNFSHILKHTL